MMHIFELSVICDVGSWTRALPSEAENNIQFLPPQTVLVKF